MTRRIDSPKSCWVVNARPLPLQMAASNSRSTLPVRSRPRPYLTCRRCPGPARLPSLFKYAHNAVIRASLRFIGLSLRTFFRPYKQVTPTATLTRPSSSRTPSTRMVQPSTQPSGSQVKSSISLTTMSSFLTVPSRRPTPTTSFPTT